MSEHSRTGYEFGPFSLDVGKRRLQRDGHPVTLAPKVLDTLVALVENRQRILTKDELLRQVWGDTIVEEGGLARNISVLRKVLGETPDDHQYIVTVPTRGYRFVAEVREGPAAGEPLPTYPPIVSGRGPAPADRLSVGRGRWLGAGLIGAAVVVIVGFVVPRLSREPSAGVGGAPMTVRHLTPLAGNELSPSLSPDGEHVAFSWNGEGEDNYDIYIKRIGSSEHRRLTTDAAPDGYPVWSADGLHIYFVREQADGGGIVRVIAANGGTDRKVSDFRVAGATPIAVSPDERWLAARPDISDELGRKGQWGIHLIPVQGGHPRRLTAAREPSLDTAPAFAPDGRSLAYAACGGEGNSICDVHVVALGKDYEPAGASRQLTRQGAPIRALAWSSDATSIVYDVPQPGRSHLWRVRVEGGRDAERLEIAGAQSRGPATAPAGNRLAFERVSVGLSVFRWLPGQTPQPVLQSSAFDGEPQFSPDGRRLAFRSGRSEASEIWLASADGSSARQLTRGPGSSQASASWSPDGRWLAFDSAAAEGRRDIWVIDSDGGAPRQVTTAPGDETLPTWSRDGTWIYFVSLSAAGREIWRVPFAGGPAERLIESPPGGLKYEAGPALAYESPDGKFLLYQEKIGDSALLAYPLAGGSTREVVSCVRDLSFGVGAGALYYSPCGSVREVSQQSGLLVTWPKGASIPIHRLDLASNRLTVLGPVVPPFDPFRLAVSPDGQTLLVHRHVSSTDLMLIENLR
jgi:Tol biopolymer transport system component/DNA-binding winged helix-turn-helix (wHTH) protein